MTDHRTLAQQANDATYDAWNAHDPDAVAAVFAGEAVLHDIANPDPVVGRDAIRDRAAGLLAAFSDFHLERVELMNSDGLVVEDHNLWDVMGLMTQLAPDAE